MVESRIRIFLRLVPLPRIDVRLMVALYFFLVCRVLAYVCLALFLAIAITFKSIMTNLFIKRRFKKTLMIRPVR